MLTVDQNNRPDCAQLLNQITEMSQKKKLILPQQCSSSKRNVSANPMMKTISPPADYSEFSTVLPKANYPKWSVEPSFISPVESSKNAMIQK